MRIWLALFVHRGPTLLSMKQDPNATFQLSFRTQFASDGILLRRRNREGRRLVAHQVGHEIAPVSRIPAFEKTFGHEGKARQFGRDDIAKEDCSGFCWPFA